MNPTFALEGCWQVYYLACPFDAYFPVPVNDQLASDTGFVTTSPYSYCKSKLKSLVTELRSKKDRITFNFYFGDCLELCLENQKLRNKCQVVHCSDLADRVGLSNLILTANRCLSTENLDAILVTDTANWVMFFGLQRPFPGTEHPVTIAEYLKISLSCPLSMIPTLYGVKLMNHVNLGSPFCVQLHDFTSTSRITLKWVRVPIFSANVKLDVSSDLQAAIDRFALASFFIKAPGCYPCGVPELPNLPLSFYYFLWSLINRCNWQQGTVESLFRKITVPSTFELDWRTQQCWMKGEPVYLYTNSELAALRCTTLKKIDMSFIQLILVSNRHMKHHDVKTGKSVPLAFLENVHCIENVSWSRR